MLIELFHDGGPYHTETSPLICSAVNQWTGFSMVGTSVMKELKLKGMFRTLPNIYDEKSSVIKYLNGF